MTGGEAQGATATSGWRDDAAGCHRFPIRVYYEDTDALGIVYYVNYLKFAERARTEMLRLLGHGQDELLAQQGIGFTVRRCEVEYFAPARLDDALEVRTRMTQIRGASMGIAQSVWRADTELARLKLRIACVTRDGRPARLPDRLRAEFEPLVGQE